MMDHTSSIPRGWIKTTLSEAIELVIDHRGLTPKKLGGDWGESGYRAISAKSIKDGHIVNEDQMNILPENLYKKWMRVEVKYADIFLTSEAPLGEHLIWKSDEKLVLSQRIFGIRTRGELLNPFYFNYFIDSSFYQHELKSRETGSTVSGIKQSELLKTKILLPSLPEQHAIASILTSLDNKIGLLRDQNGCLESTVQEIFKEWFINFNYPNFSNKMVDSELGKIPEAWRIGKIGEVTSIRGGTTPSTQNQDFWNGDIGWTSPKDLSGSKAIFLLKTEKKITEKGLNQIGSGLLPVQTLLLSSRAPIGYLAITNLELAINQGYIAFLPNQYFPTNFMYLWLKANMDTIIGSANGSTFLEISKSSFRNIDCVIPSHDVIIKFCNTINPIFKKILSNSIEIQSLSTTRGILLPKLMNGEIRVK